MISILLPVYNAALYLPACLDTILAQSETDWELLAVNDFSEDDSWEILKQYAHQDKRIQVFQNKEKGVIPALRLAFEHSSGALITRMDADDLMTVQKLSWLQQVLKAKGPGFLATGLVEYFSETTLGDGYRRYANWLNKLALADGHYKEIYRECVIPSPCWMVYRDDLLRCDAFSPDTYPEDYDLCFRFYQQGLRPVSVSEVLHHWRDHGSRASRNDPHYADNRFFQLKVHYFLQLDYQSQRPLVLWGAGAKGKLLARLLLEQNISFHWVCNNPRKWGLDIYGVRMQQIETIYQLEHPQFILAVSSPEGQEQINHQLKNGQWKPKIHYFWFC